MVASGGSLRGVAPGWNFYQNVGGRGASADLLVLNSHRWECGESREKGSMD